MDSIPLLKTAMPPKLLYNNGQTLTKLIKLN